MPQTVDLLISECMNKLEIPPSEIDGPSMAILRRDNARFQNQIIRECAVPVEEYVVTLEGDVKEYPLPPCEIKRVWYGSTEITQNQVTPQEMSIK